MHNTSAAQHQGGPDLLQLTVEQQLCALEAILLSIFVFGVLYVGCIDPSVCKPSFIFLFELVMAINMRPQEVQLKISQLANTDRFTLGLINGHCPQYTTRRRMGTGVPCGTVRSHACPTFK